MVDDLFHLSRATSAALQLDLMPLALGEVVSDAVAAGVSGAAESGVHIEAESPESWPTVLGSDIELTRVVRNLVTNALRYTPPGGVIRLSAETEGGYARLYVQDACGGISPADIERIFDVGYRGSVARTPGDTSGAGLGLAIARALTEAHGGTVTVENRHPGCRFALTLPLYDAPAHGHAAAEPRSAPEPARRA
jgi:signal transduction histidine kinase